MVNIKSTSFLSILFFLLDKQSFQKLFDTPAIIPTLLQVLVNTRDVNLYDGISRLLLILVCNNCGFVVERFNVDANVVRKARHICFIFTLLCVNF